MKLVRFTLAAVMAFGFSFAVKAEVKDADKGDGCGLGWEITSKRTMSATTTRGTTNAFVPPTFGMTSGTINCVQHPVAKKEGQAVAFAMNNLEQIRSQASEGQGDHLVAFAETLGCSANGAEKASVRLQKNYGKVFGNSSAQPSDVYSNMRNEVQIACNLG